ncbi:MAG: hypothetical protein ACI36X_04050 [Bacteroidaceae bacterium]
MKSFLLTKLPVLVLSICAGVCTSCKDDDEDGFEDAGAPQGPAVEFDGKLLTNVGGSTFVYDKKGRCVSMTDRYGDGMKIFYDEGVCVYYYDNKEEGRGDISFNKRGYISHITYDSSGSDGDWVSTESVNFTYNSNGNLIAVSMSGSYVGVEDGNPYKETWTDEAEYTWKNGNLASVYGVFTDIENGEMFKEIVETTCTYGKQENKFRQWTESMNDTYYLEEFIGLVGFTGMLGVAPMNLVSKVEYQEEEKEYDATGKIISSETYTDSEEYTYVLNEDGSIQKEQADYSTYLYTYSEFGNSSSVTAPVRTMQRSERVRPFFFKKHRMHRAR